jgi:glycine betaine catabolism A
VPALSRRASEALAAGADLRTGALLEERDDPEWREHLGDDDPKYKGGLRAGAATWSRDGQATGIPFPGLSDADRKAGHVYMTGLPSMFIVGHVDYVRVVRLLPLGAERTELRVEYLFVPRTLESRGSTSTTSSNSPIS